MAPVVVNLTYYIKNGTEDKFWAASKRVLDATRADSGLKYMNIWKIATVTEEVAFRLIEVWEGDIEQLKEASQKRDGMKEFQEVYQDIKTKDMVIEPLIQVEGQEYRNLP